MLLLLFQCLVNVFHLCYSSASAALLPFLTLFFRQLGLSATQVGVIISVKSVLAVMFSALWTNCAISCEKRRSVLMTSVFSAMVVCLLMSVVPPSKDARTDPLCLESGVNSSLDMTNPSVSNTNETTSYEISSLGSTTTAAIIPSAEIELSSTMSTTKLPQVTNNVPTTVSSKSTHLLSSQMLTTTTKRPSRKTTPKSAPTTAIGRKKTKSFTKISVMPTTSPRMVQRSTDRNNNPWDMLSDSDKKLFQKFGLTEEKINSLNEEKLQELLNKIIEQLEEEQSHNGQSENREKRDILSSSLQSLNNRLSELQGSLSTSTNTVFMLVLCIIIIGEVFSSCTLKLADRIWFDFLDGLDLVEKYGSHHAWCTLGYVLIPMCVTAAVDHTACVLSHHIKHFNIHFYTYSALMGVTFIWAFLYPMLDANKKITRSTKVVKGLKVLFADAHTFSYLFSVLLLGVLTVSIDNFLFWKVQDLGGREMVMGGAVTIGAFVEFFVIVLMKQFIKKITNAGAVVLAFLLMTLRLVSFSFMWTPYLVLPLAVLHPFTHTLILGSVENYPDFKVNPFIMDRSARSVLNGIYLAIGYAGGSALSGFLYDSLDSEDSKLRTVYQGGAIMAAVWCGLFALIHRCFKHKPRVRYTRLLQAEADQFTDDEESVDGDWLETALKLEK